METTYEYYQLLSKPVWAPRAELFGPVWTLLYVLIAISFGYVTYLFLKHQISFAVLLPFALNLFFNVLFTPLAFGLQSLWLASLDVVLVFVTLVWAMIKIFPHARWVVFINVPYLLWVTFASILQITITVMNVF